MESDAKEVFSSWAKEVVDELGRALESVCTDAITVTLGRTEVLADVELRAALPDAGAAYLATPEGRSRDRGACLVASRALLEALDATAVEAQEDGEGDRGAARFGRICSDVLRASLSTAAASAPAWENERTAEIADSVWVDGRDPIASGEILVARLGLAVGDAGPSEGFLILAAEAAHGLLDAAPSACADAPVCLVFTPELDARLAAALPGATRVDSEVAFLGALAAGADAVLVEVPRGREPVLGMVRGYLDLHADREIAVVVVLEDPSTWSVLQCGRLGFWAVTGPDVDADVLADRFRRARACLMQA